MRRPEKKESGIAKERKGVDWKKSIAKRLPAQF